MATLLELFDYSATSEYLTLSKKIAVACAIKAKAIGDLETPTAAQIEWARVCLDDPLNVADSVINYVLAANSTYTIAQINSATDAAIQAQVNNAVDNILSL